ncbi:MULTISPECIES: amidase [unclassified Serratia (in: enterobacteria)]|uniref:amidase n=1 Tax=unclassified Serratia (in: enterobacteria) TaxID=2647522 RepID=UPI00307606C3
MNHLRESNAYIERFTLGQGDLRFAVKDTLDVAGHATQAGCRALALAPPALRHAQIVDTLLNQRCILTGKTTLHELAFGVTGINPWSGTPLNPQYPQLIPGGSSSGSAAAVAAGEVDFAIGTDTGGSVRMPAACCGILGLKPTYGLLSRQGVMPAASSLDCVGLFAREAAVLREVLGRLAIPAEDALHSLPPIGLISAAAPRIDALIHQQLLKAEARLQPIVLPELELAYFAGITLISHENWQAFHSLLEVDGVSNDIASRIRLGESVSPTELAKAEQVRRSFSDRLDSLLASTPLLALATLPELPPLLSEAGDPLKVVSMTRLVRPFNLSGHPAISLPIGEIDGRPVALQLVASKGRDAMLVEAAGYLLARLHR